MLDFLQHMFLQKNKKNNYKYFTFAFLVLATSVFFLTPSVAHAALFGFGDTFSGVFKALLYGVFVAFSWFTSLAITILGWAINPEFISGPTGFFNRASIYEMWKFIRDFFNLFFILTLLYTAFTIVFQVAGDYKKTLLSLVLAALFVNFSFPITRFMIDASNVPMYFFANQMFEGTGQANVSGSLGTVLGASNIKEILVPNKLDQTDISHLLMAIIFIFIFSISLLVIAVLLVIRLVALLILLIFSSVGFAASVVPGLQGYGKKWWENFAKHALFGPVAMLMLFICTRFFAEISQATDPTRAALTAVARANAVQGEESFFAAMAMFSIPIIMLWMTIGLAGSLAGAGGASIAGAGQKFGKWVGRGTARGLGRGGKWVGLHNPVTRLARGVGMGLGGRAADTRLVKGIKNAFTSPSKIEAGAKSWAGGKGWKKGVSTEYDKYKEKQLQEKLEEHKKNKTNASTLEKDLKEGDEIEKKAAAIALAESKDITSAERLSLALKAVAGDVDRYRKVMASAQDGTTAGMTADQMIEATAERDSEGNIKTDPATGKAVINQTANDELTRKLKKDGNAKAIVDYEVKQNNKGRREAVRDVIASIKSSKDLVKQESLFVDDPNTPANERTGAFARAEIQSNATRYQAIKKVASEEAPAVAAVI